MSDINSSFGYRQVTPDERRARIGKVFQAVAPRYDLMNDLMSLGIHRLWKRSLVGAVAPLPGQVIVDLAGGTGDVAALMAGKGARAVVCDPSQAMMEVGRRRPGRETVEWLTGAAEEIPLPDASVDALTISFGLRNVTRIEAALAEMHRVLKPGGRLFCLEFSRPHALIKPFYDVFSHLVIPRLGAWIANEPDAYTYLIESIRRFPDQQELCGLFREAGFAGVAFRNLSFGIACIHQGVRSA